MSAHLASERLNLILCLRLLPVQRRDVGDDGVGGALQGREPPGGRVRRSLAGWLLKARRQRLWFKDSGLADGRKKAEARARLELVELEGHADDSLCEGQRKPASRRRASQFHCWALGAASPSTQPARRRPQSRGRPAAPGFEIAQDLVHGHRPGDFAAEDPEQNFRAAAAAEETQRGEQEEVGQPARRAPKAPEARSALGAGHKVAPVDGARLLLVVWRQVSLVAEQPLANLLREFGLAPAAERYVEARDGGEHENGAEEDAELGGAPWRRASGAEQGGGGGARSESAPAQQ